MAVIDVKVSRGRRAYGDEGRRTNSEGQGSQVCKPVLNCIFSVGQGIL